MNDMDEADVLPAAQGRVIDRLADVRDADIGLDGHPDVAAAVAAMRQVLTELADALAAAGRAEKIEP